ncbi:MAG: hypothetical protein E2O90_12340 [Alphaproteobacteria bacterium]|nr:MAG: hypothetical protein E2O90_12340 [Alphaproteobacteria bacterium]
MNARGIGAHGARLGRCRALYSSGVSGFSESPPPKTAPNISPKEVSGGSSPAASAGEALSGWGLASAEPSSVGSSFNLACFSGACFSGACFSGACFSEACFSREFSVARPPPPLAAGSGFRADFDLGFSGEFASAAGAGDFALAGLGLGLAGGPSLVHGANAPDLSILKIRKSRPPVPMESVVPAMMDPPSSVAKALVARSKPSWPCILSHKTLPESSMAISRISVFLRFPRPWNASTR